MRAALESAFRLGAVWLLLLAPSLAADTTWVYVASEGGRIAAVSAADDDIRSLQLTEGSPAGIFPTPGGKYVFVTFVDSPKVAVVDAEVLAEHRTFDFDEGVPDRIAFSPMGEKAYVSFEGSPSIVRFEHSRSELTRRDAASIGLAGSPIVLNRRGTRIYRSTATGLAFYLEDTFQEIRRVALPTGPAFWRFTPDYRYLWGVGLNGGRAVVVDERRAREVEQLAQAFAPSQPAMSDDGSQALLLDADRRTIHVYDARSRRLQADVSLPGRVDDVVQAGGTVWASNGKDGLLYRIAVPTLSLEAPVEIGGRITALGVVTVRPDQGFACF